MRWKFSALPPALQRYLPVVALFTLANSSNLFLLLRARQLGVAQAQIPLLWAAISAVAMVGSTPLAAWSDRIGRRRWLVAGYGAYGVFYLLIGQLRGSGPWLLLCSPATACSLLPPKESRRRWWPISRQRASGAQPLDGST